MIGIVLLLLAVTMLGRAQTVSTEALSRYVVVGSEGKTRACRYSEASRTYFDCLEMNASAITLPTSTCSSAHILEALNAVADLVPETPEQIEDKKLWEEFQSVDLAKGGWVTTEYRSNWSKDPRSLEQKSPAELRAEADRREQAELERQERVKRQRAAVTLYRDVLKQCGGK